MRQYPDITQSYSNREFLFPTSSAPQIRKYECTRDDLDDLFEEAMELPESEREAFLDKTCFGQPGLRWHLELLITHSNQQPPDNFLNPDELSDIFREY